MIRYAVQSKNTGWIYGLDQLTMSKLLGILYQDGAFDEEPEAEEKTLFIPFVNTKEDTYMRDIELTRSGVYALVEGVIRETRKIYIRDFRRNGESGRDVQEIERDLKRGCVITEAVPMKPAEIIALWRKAAYSNEVVTEEV